MNTYRVTLTAIMADSRDYDVEASTEADAWEAAEDRMNADLPDLQEIRRDDLELLTAAPVEPTPDPLAQAREIIGALLDAANHGVTELESLAIDALSDEEDQPESDDDAFRRNRELRADYDRRSQEAWAAIEAARAFLATQEPTTCPE